MVNVVRHRRMPRNIQRTIHSFFKVVFKDKYLAPVAGFAVLAGFFFTGVFERIAVPKKLNEFCNKRWIHLNTTGNYFDYHTRFYF